MPLIKSPSKKALSKNIATEMRANPAPEKRAQNIAIAYATKKQAMKHKKKMAEGGEITANSEKRASIDDALDSRDMAMEEGAMPSKKPELSELLESMSGNSIDKAMDEREMAMKRHMAKGGEVSFDDESMSEDSIDHARDERDLHMMDGKSVSHKAALLAKDIGKPDEDSEDEMEVDMLHMARGGSIADAIMKKRMMAEGGEVDLQENEDEDLNSEDDMSFEAARKKTYADDSQLDSQPEDSNEHGDSEEASAEDEHDMVSSIRSKLRSKRMI